MNDEKSIDERATRALLNGDVGGCIAIQNLKIKVGVNEDEAN